jgi:hypothetical protein
MILQHLHKHYNKKGKDFYFKSKHLNLPTIDNRVKGRLLKQLADEGKINRWSNPHSRKVITFITNFKNNGEKTI